LKRESDGETLRGHVPHFAGVIPEVNVDRNSAWPFVWLLLKALVDYALG
jgi:hypothetical protein